MNMQNPINKQIICAWCGIKGDRSFIVHSEWVRDEKGPYKEYYDLCPECDEKKRMTRKK